jgi:hypothetical protein
MGLRLVRLSLLYTNMCDPVTLITGASLLASLGGTAASVIGSNNASRQANNAAENALQQTQNYQTQASNVWQQSMNQSTPAAAQQQIGSGQAQALAATQAAQATPLSLSSSPVPQGTVSDKAQNVISNQANAANQGYSEYGLQQGIKNLLANQNLNLLSGQAQTAAGVLPMQLASANNNAQGTMGLGSLLQTGGYLGGLYGASQPKSFNNYPANAPGFSPGGISLFG